MGPCTETDRREIVTNRKIKRKTGRVRSHTPAGRLKTNSSDPLWLFMGTGVPYIEEGGQTGAPPPRGSRPRLLAVHGPSVPSRATFLPRRMVLPHMVQAGAGKLSVSQRSDVIHAHRRNPD